jgi:Fur family transcriptional regulator, zinc uptake regulator
MTARSLQSAERLCEDRGLAFTPLRRQVYALIADEETPLGAYELLDRLKKERANAAPVTVYRALDFLLEAGLIHRIDALQAYAACEIEDPHQHAGHGGLMLVCNRCKNVIEFSNAGLERQIARTALEHGFRVGRSLIEIRGLCAACAASA